MSRDGDKVWKKEELEADINIVMYRVVGENTEELELPQQSALVHVPVLKLLAL